MIEHFKLLSFLVILFSGIWVISYLKQVYKSFPDKVIKAIMIYSLWFIFLETIQFSIIYISVNFTHGEYSCLPDCLDFALSFGVLFSLYLMLNILLCFRGKSLKKSHSKWLILIASFIIISFIIKTSIPEFHKIFGWIDYIKSSMYSLFRITTYIEVLILIGFYFYWRKSKQSIERIKISKSFILIFFFANGMPSILYYTLRLNTIPPNYIWIIPFSVNFIFFIITFLWTKFIFVNYAQKIPNVINKNDNFKSIYEKYKISKRESEIIELLIDGKSSNEIKEYLFLSYHTVKNHISHIYEKLNVKTRHELIKFFGKKQ